jgi:hypothetical protein
MEESENIVALRIFLKDFVPILSEINDKLGDILKRLVPKEKLDTDVLLSVPDHIRKTINELTKLGRATADEVASHTKRARAVESAYLNQLVTMNYVFKERKGRKAYFSMIFDE